MLALLQISYHSIRRTPPLVVIVLLLFLTVSSCSREGKSDENGHEETHAIEKISLVITEEGVGTFRIGSDIPIDFNDPQKELTRTSVTINREGEQFEEPWYVLSENGSEVLRLLPAYDPDLEEYSTQIEEIRVVSPVCTTISDIHVGSSLHDLTASYKSVNLWYSYVSDFFVAEVPELQGVQFHLDHNGFIGSHDDLMDSDMVFLSRADFRPDTQIHTIRIIGEIQSITDL